jgi:alpha-ribazole phosphatase
MLLTLIRHGEVDGRPQVLRGRTDEALSAAGHQQLQEIVATVQSNVDVIVSSPMKRCHEFAVSMSKQRKVPLHIVDQLREIDFGEWENMTLAEAEAHNSQCFHTFKNDTEHWHPPAGESYSAFRERVRDALVYILALKSSHILAITHGGVIRAILAECLQLTPASAARIGVPLAGLCQLWIDDDGNGSLLRLQWIERPC